jgi:hypothetical protein
MRQEIARFLLCTVCVLSVVGASIAQVDQTKQSDLDIWRRFVSVIRRDPRPFRASPPSTMSRLFPRHLELVLARSSERTSNLQ